MQLDGLWTVHTLLALSGFALGNPILNEPLAAPRVFISFKGRNLRVVLNSFLLLTADFLTVDMTFVQQEQMCLAKC